MTADTAGAVFPCRSVLSDGSVYRVVPVEAGVRAIRAWAEYLWPMSPAQALALRDRLGWTSSPTDEEIRPTVVSVRRTPGFSPPRPTGVPEPSPASTCL